MDSIAMTVRQSLGWMLAACLAWVALVGAPQALLFGQAPGGDGLRWRLAPDSTHTLSFRQTTDSLTTVNKVVARMRIVMGAELRWHVDSVEADGAMRITQTLARLTMKMSAGGEGEDVEFDSASMEPLRGPARDIAAAARPLVGMQTHFRMTPRGEILEARLSEESEKVSESLAGRENVLYLFSAEGLTETLRQAMPRLPEGAPQVGQSWDQTTRVALATGKLTQQNTYTYRGPQAAQPHLADIGLAAQLALEPAPEPAGPRVALVDQRTSGELVFDIQTGKFHKASIRQTLVTQSPFRDEIINVQLESLLELDVR